MISNAVSFARYDLLPDTRRTPYRRWSFLCVILLFVNISSSAEHNLDHARGEDNRSTGLDQKLCSLTTDRLRQNGPSEATAEDTPNDKAALETTLPDAMSEQEDLDVDMLRNSVASNASHTPERHLNRGLQCRPSTSLNQSGSEQPGDRPTKQ